MILSIAPDGTIKALYTEAIDLRSFGRCHAQRASHVEPTVDDDTWNVNLSPVSGPLLGPFHKRSEALAAEAAWIERNVL